jgi:pimeloyl-ACP methyl ester carboxylesterase
MQLTRRGVTFVASLVGLAAIALIVLDSTMEVRTQLVVWTVAGLVVAGLIVWNDEIRDRRQTWIELIAAVFGLPIALGYAIVHSIELSLPAAALGIVATFAWLVVLIGTSAAILRRASWLGRLVAIPVALLIAQFVLMPVAAGTAGAHPPRMALDQTTPAGAMDVVISVKPGTQLNGWYMPGSNGAAVVVLPGADGNRAQTVAHATVLALHGYSVLAIDARGSGDSPGIGHMWGWYGEEDITAALNWLEVQPGVDGMRLGLVGLSMGGEQAVTIAPFDHRVKAVVAEGVEARMPADTWYMGDDLRGQIERVFNAIMWVTSDVWSDASQPPSLGDAAVLNTTPLLIIAADAPGERAVASDLAARSPAVQVWQTSRIGHTQALALAPAEWEARVTSFLETALAPR